MALTNYVNVLIHGLFFMWLNQETKFLELRAPEVDPSGTTNPHHLLGGIRGFLREYKNEDIDWTNIGLIGSDAPTLQPGQLPDNLKSSILQFSMTDAGISAWNKDSKLVGKFILPWPSGFSSLRYDYWERSFVYYTEQDGAYTSNVGKAIRKRCYGDRNTQIGLATCLQYTYDDGVGISVKPWRPNINLHCYFEPCIKHSILDVDADLKKAGECFLPAGGFDLQMNVEKLEGIVTPVGNGPGYPPGCDKNDEYSLTDDPHKPKDICTGSGRYPLNVSPANCPNFFVGP